MFPLSALWHFAVRCTYGVIPMVPMHLAKSAMLRLLVRLQAHPCSTGEGDEVNAGTGVGCYYAGLGACDAEVGLGAFAGLGACSCDARQTA
jgi:hypothetical protein